MAGEIFEGTALIPDVIADGVVDEARAALAADGSDECMAALEALGPGAGDALSAEMVERADDAYVSDPAFRAAVGGCDGRGALWAIMRDWAADGVARISGRDVLTATRGGFGTPGG